jgi:type I pantothenate kinase
VRSLHDRLDIQEVEEIYLPLSRLLSLYVAATQRLFRAQQDFLGTQDSKMPYIIGVGGSRRCASTTARVPKHAGALAQRSQGRPRYHRRLSLSQRHPRPRRPDGEKRLSGKL